ncbi:phosphotransferase [Streptomyces sp. NPDC051561]|uniref:phosphotransferase n=1 Tax=Streptomyces sp. NPDC051561 TaxID=3365658 RepID=UPI0037AEAE8F
MGDLPVAVLSVPKPPATDVYDAFVEEAKRTGEMTRGFHNRNFRVTLTRAMAELVGEAPGMAVTVRVPVPGAVPVVLRTWRDESQILEALTGALPHARCLFKGVGSAIHSYVEGAPLSTICPPGKPLDSRLVEAMASLLARMTEVRRKSLPPLPADWPGSGRSRAFLHRLAVLTDRNVRLANWTDFGGLFVALGIAENALLEFAERVPAMSHRPFSLLHTDLHRDNVIVTFDGEPPLVCIDWELATWGDPLHDLATHLVRMHYPAHQLEDAVQAWYRAMRATRPDAVRGLDTDLRHYLDFERAQSVYPDIMRAARSLGEGPEPVGMRHAVESVSRALEAARVPLQLDNLPDPEEIERILHRRHAARFGGSPWMPLVGAWWSQVDEATFPHRAVTEALVGEGTAPSKCVFKGTGHLSTVVYARSAERAVVVRRKLRSDTRREPTFLEEDQVLRALEGTSVRAPRLLALGESGRQDPFVVHSYEGPTDGPPSHPVDGLLPQEADALVDQLGAVAGLDARELDPTVSPGGFYQWLSAWLVVMVDGLPKESRELAVVLGLPDACRLKEILDDRTVTPRHPVLLHGDLNPWNLVRSGSSGELTLIDWEMAMVGDPLYDLVRHFHLTPTKAEIRRRMLRRWERVLGARGEEYVEGWSDDVDTYRWIELVRSAYIDLDRLVTGASLDAPNVGRAVDSYPMTLQAAKDSLGMRGMLRNPYLLLALSRERERGRGRLRTGPHLNQWPVKAG